MSIDPAGRLVKLEEIVGPLSNGGGLARLRGMNEVPNARVGPQGAPGEKVRPVKYMFLAYESAADFAARTGKDGPAYREGWMAYGAALREAGAFVAGAGLQPADRGATLRAPDGKRAVQDGPYADTKDQLGGYFVIEAPSLDAALELASKSPAAKNGAVEVRPVRVGGDAPGTAAGEKLALLIYQTPAEIAARSGPDAKAHWDGWAAYGAALREAGAFIAGVGLQAAETATTVRSREGRRLVQDGPYADTKEQLGGVFIVGASSLDAALSWASRCPTAATGAVEVRPLITGL